MNINDIDESFSRLDSTYMKYVDNIKNIDLNKELPSDYILYLKSRWYFLKGNIKKLIFIGDGAIIGANAVVNRDVLPFTVVAGSPAKIIGEVTASNFDKYSGFYWCKNNNNSSQKFCEWYKAIGKLKE